VIEEGPRRGSWRTEGVLLPRLPRRYLAAVRGRARADGRAAHACGEESGRDLLTVAPSDEYRWQNARERLAFPEPVVVERCASCSFTAVAPVEEARQFAEHVCDRPKPARSAQRRSGFGFR
jgi:hypothetical protein